MSEKGKIRLETSSILRVPLHIYDKFTFVVNGERFETTKIIADLISNKISQIHHTDPTVNEYLINTREKGDFSIFLKLINYEEFNYSENEFSFIYEIINELGTESINFSFPKKAVEITNDNIISIIQYYQKYEKLDTKEKKESFDYLSSHFGELIETKKEEIMELDVDTLSIILNNELLEIKDEDQLLHFVNLLYQKDKKYSMLYCCIIFSNVGLEMMNEFINLFDLNDINIYIWKSISERLQQEIKNNFNDSKNNKRYKEEEKKTFLYQKDVDFNGIINYLSKQTNIDDELNITASSTRNGDIPKNVTIFKDDNKYFYSEDKSNNWLCFDFKKHKVFLTNYTIKSKASAHNPKTWVIEGSNDQKSWEIIDTQNDFPGLEKYNQICTFTISNKKNESYRYIRIRQTGKEWGNKDILVINSFELYGTLT